MWWRLPNSGWKATKGADRKVALKSMTDEGGSPGLLGYVDGAVAGWCSVAPRPEYARLERSRILKPVDDRPVWSIVCFFISPRHRRGGVGSALLRAAADFAAAHGAELVEGYPVEPRKGRMPDAFAFTGLASMFLAAGFIEVERRSPTRPIMRKELAKN
jgi:GNAT superfamily N-acetyltransferase